MSRSRGSVPGRGPATRRSAPGPWMQGGSRGGGDVGQAPPEPARRPRRAGRCERQESRHPGKACRPAEQTTDSAQGACLHYRAVINGRRLRGFPERGKHAGSFQLSKSLKRIPMFDIYFIWGIFLKLKTRFHFNHDVHTCVCCTHHSLWCVIKREQRTLPQT